MHRLRKLFAGRWAGDQRGAVSPLMALMIVPIAGATAMATEMGAWWYFQRSLQNAADSAAIAAASNANAGSTGITYDVEGRAVAGQFGYVDGQRQATVKVTTVACPPGLGLDAVCYQAALTKVAPVALSRLVGFRGDKNNGFGQTIAATAVAVGAGLPGQACVLTLSGDSDSLLSHGTPVADFNGCNVVSWGGAKCTGQGLHATRAITAGTITGTCTDNPASSYPFQPQTSLPKDDLAPLKDKIPSDPCGGKYPGATLGPSDTIKPYYCGNVTLTGNVTLAGSKQILIYNGQLDVGNYDLVTQLTTDPNSGTTLIFSGNSSQSVTDVVTGKKGKIDICAPGSCGRGDSSSPWNGVAIYQDPRMGQGTLDIAGNGSVSLFISGIIYLPKTDFTMSGNINKGSNGLSCAIIVSYKLTLDGSVPTGDRCAGPVPEISSNVVKLVR
ncbi:MAG: pilus assembly protein TadG-related protein [Novosphingobium sp.]|jgi:Flp pilus assembly protein TadG|nr:pilus assembly protein TadG-related protein [Novosphingobium sp.]